MQRGSLRKRHGAWHLRYYTTEVGPEGLPVRRQVTAKLARVCDEYRTRTDVWPLALPILTRANGPAAAEGSLTLAEFIDGYFLPYLTAKRNASTVHFYRVVIDKHIRPRVGHVRLREFQTRHAQELLDAVPLSHSTLRHIKVYLSSVFSYALRLGFLSGANPVREAKCEGYRTEPKRAVYTLAEVEAMLKKLSEPARTVCALAAFSGLSESEIRGLQWPDYDGTYLHVRRGVWRTAVDETKTATRADSVPVIRPLRVLLDAHKRRNGSSQWMFAGERKGFSLNLDNLCARSIRPVLGKQWRGWHAFRRGLATTLYGLGVPPEVAQRILRHASAETTRRHYIVLSSEKEGRAAMRRLEKALKSGPTVGQSKRPKRKKPA